MSKLQRYRFIQEDLAPRSRLQRWAIALRSYTLGPLTSSSPEIAKFLGGGSSSATGVPVNESTALNYSAFWSAVSMISSNCAQLPLIPYKRLPNGGKERQTGTKLYRLLHDQPNAENTSIVWRRTVQAHALTWGNGYTEIERDGGGKPVALWPLTPDRVTPFRRGSDAPLQYRIVNAGGTPDTILDAHDMIHIPGLGWDGTRGYSVVEKARESLGLGLAAERFGAKFFGNGATFGGVLSYKGPRPTELSDKNYVEMLKGEHQGVDRAHKLLAVYNDATYSRLGIPPNDAQFLETRQFQVTEIARWFNIPPHKIGDLMRATFSNIEQQDLDYYKTTLVNWLETWEQELTAKLIPSSELNLQFIEHVVEGFLRGDTTARGEFHSKQFNLAAITPNEIREIENRNPIDGGNRAFVALNMIPLDRYDEWLDAEIASKKSKTQPPSPPPPAPRDREIELEMHLATVTTERDAARRKAQAAEDLADLAKAGQVELRAEALRLAATITDLKAGIETDQSARLASEALVVDFRRLRDEATTAWGQERSALARRAAASESALAQLSNDAALSMQQWQDRIAAAEQTARESAEARQQATIEHDRVVHAMRQTNETRAAAIIDSHRGLIVDALGRMVRQEVAKARGHDTTQEKLRRWLQSYDVVHAPVCIDALLPALRAHLAWMGSDEDVTAVATTLVQDHLREFSRRLGAALEADPQDFPVILARVLDAWEAHRADDVARVFMEREIAHVRA